VICTRFTPSILLQFTGSKAISKQQTGWILNEDKQSDW